MDSVVITGVSTGIGLSAAEILCESGYKVFGSVRKIEDSDHLSSKYPNFKPLVFDVMVGIPQAKLSCGVYPQGSYKEGNMDISIVASNV